jgi:hypothetical protein
MSVSSSNDTRSRSLDSAGKAPPRPLRKNHHQQIRQRLIAGRGGELSSSELARISPQYNARVSELREAEFLTISREVQDGAKHGFSRLLQPPISRHEAASPVQELRLDLKQGGQP